MTDNQDTVEAEDTKAVDMIADFDLGSRDPDGWQGKLLASVALVWALFQIYTASNIPFVFNEMTGMSAFWLWCSVALSSSAVGGSKLMSGPSAKLVATSAGVKAWS